MTPTSVSVSGITHQTVMKKGRIQMRGEKPITTSTTPLPLPTPDAYWVIPGRLLAGEYPGHKEEAQRQMVRGWGNGHDTMQKAKHSS
jgi:hypothetical protein